MEPLHGPTGPSAPRPPGEPEVTASAGALGSTPGGRSPEHLFAPPTAPADIANALLAEFRTATPGQLGVWRETVGRALDALGNDLSTLTQAQQTGGELLPARADATFHGTPETAFDALLQRLDTARRDMVERAVERCAAFKDEEPAADRSDRGWIAKADDYDRCNAAAMRLLIAQSELLQILCPCLDQALDAKVFGAPPEGGGANFCHHALRFHVMRAMAGESAHACMMARWTLHTHRDAATRYAQLEAPHTNAQAVLDWICQGEREMLALLRDRALDLGYEEALRCARSAGPGQGCVREESLILQTEWLGIAVYTEEIAGLYAKRHTDPPLPEGRRGTHAFKLDPGDWQRLGSGGHAHFLAFAIAGQALGGHAEPFLSALHEVREAAAGGAAVDAKCLEEAGYANDALSGGIAALQRAREAAWPGSGSGAPTRAGADPDAARAAYRDAWLSFRTFRNQLERVVALSATAAAPEITRLHEAAAALLDHLPAHVDLGDDTAYEGDIPPEFRTLSQDAYERLQWMLPFTQWMPAASDLRALHVFEALFSDHTTLMVHCMVDPPAWLFDPATLPHA